MATMPGESSLCSPRCCSHRSPLFRGWHLAVLATILPSAGCRSEVTPSSNYPYAYASPTCAPWDGPAVTIYLTPTLADSIAPGAAHLSISIWTSASELPGRSFSWPTDKQTGAGVRCARQGDCEAAAAGRVAFRPFAADSVLEGSFDLLFSDSTSERGGFRAAWRPRQELCG